MLYRVLHMMIIVSLLYHLHIIDLRCDSVIVSATIWNFFFLYIHNFMYDSILNR